MKTRCWLIGEPGRRLSSQLQAASRGLALEIRGFDALSNISRAAGTLIALDFDCLQRLAPGARANLSEQIKAGATCYVGGGLPAGAHYSLEPLASVDFQVVVNYPSQGYTLTAQPLLPAALRGELVDGSYNIPVARGLSELAQPLILVRAGDGGMAPSLFAVEQGSGVIICDLAGCGGAADAGNRSSLSLLRLLENASLRPAIVGPLVAFDRAAGRDPARPLGCNIVIDDRPANLDYFNVGALRAFLGYLARRCPEIHVDFGWTPDQNRPSYRYVETLKQFNAGFVWHGLLHHIDHRTVASPELDFEQGRLLVADISERYQVRFQPVMVFPYEKDTGACLALLERAGFIAKAETPDETSAATDGEARAVTESEMSGGGAYRHFITLNRDSIETLTRDRMLARAALGMPIIIAAHPRDVALRRLAKLRRNGRSVANFDEMLDFVIAKGLRPQSLEQLALNELAQ